ncbi:site-specific integrase [Modestobacter sp. KNN46-3]|jgi:integrase|uniref:site-specific integrase n=1 Tax=Modestobacter sp. KNN46-3 TaxID=2711218 RepID=UPI0013E02AB7|nr:site-specific integrase [Modestobacter sp. KNN46-3]
MTAALPLSPADDDLPTPVRLRPPFTLSDLIPGAPADPVRPLPALPAVSLPQAVTAAAGYENDGDRPLAPNEALALAPAIWREHALFPTEAGLDAAITTLTRFAAWLRENKIDDLRAVDTPCASRFINGKFDGEPTLEHKHWRRMTLIVTWLTLDHLGVPTAARHVSVVDGPAWLAAASRRRGPAGAIPAPQLFRLTELQRNRALKARRAGKKSLPADVLPDRPLTEIEIVAGRLTVAGWTPASRDQATITWALAEAGAGTGEIPSVRGTDFDDVTTPTHVSLVGTRDAAPRIVGLTPWGCAQAARVLRKLERTAVPAGATVAYTGRKNPEDKDVQASIGGTLNRVLDAAGITGGDVAPHSIRHWAGRHAYDASGRLSAAAAVLGRDYGIDCLRHIALDPRESSRGKSPPRAVSGPGRLLAVRGLICFQGRCAAAKQEQATLAQRCDGPGRGSHGAREVDVARIPEQALPSEDGHQPVCDDGKPGQGALHVLHLPAVQVGVDHHLDLISRRLALDP